MSITAIELMLKRRSVVAKMLSAPGPDGDELDTILTAGVRVPDHKMLAPWRLVVFEGEARRAFGAVLAGVACLENDDMVFSGEAIASDRERLDRAPVVIAVISTMKDTKPVPEWEQTLSAGAVCQNIVMAASALGYAAQWITEWPAYSAALRPVLSLEDGERIAGFIYVGTAQTAPKERARPALDAVVSRWHVPDARADS